MLNAQSGAWVWMNGSKVPNSAGTYGTQGVASVNNSPPALYQAGQWTDKQGNLWIYGGAHNFELDTTFSDLWKFDPLSNTWTWVKGTGTPNLSAVYGMLGVPAMANTPGPRGWGLPTWTDTIGDLWLFGGFDPGFGIFNDLWRYNIASNEWTWMGGPDTANGSGVYGNLYQPSDSSLPPSRHEANTAWTDANNNLWLFGAVCPGGFCNDMWRYSIASGQWAWMGGSQLPGAPDSYGLLGVESANNAPGARCAYTHWVDSGYLYLSGGGNWSAGYNQSINYSDIWRFNLNTNYWTWIGGDTGEVQTGQYSTFCSTSNGDEPMGRFEQRSALLKACSPVLFMWGGCLDAGPDIVLNDLWSFDLPTRKWKWISGSSTMNAVGHYGSQGVSSASNMPPAACGACFWSDNNANLWLWGGVEATGFPNTYTPKFLNAMWKYIPDPACFPGGIAGSTVNIASNKNNICPSDTAQICAPAGFTSYIWNTGDTTPCINTQSAGNYYVTVSENGNCSAVSNHVSISVYGTPPVSISVNGDTLTGYNAVTYQWLLNGVPIANANSSVYIAHTFGSYTLQVTDTNGCTTTSSPVEITSIANELAESNITVFPNPTRTGWQLSVNVELLGSAVEVFDATGRLVFLTTINKQLTTIEVPELAKGVYQLRITAKEYKFVAKLIKI